MELPRITVVFRLWQRDKQNHGWPAATATDRPLLMLQSRGPAVTPPAKSDSNERILPYAASSDLISLDIGQ
jgi:hypothetical protein